MNIKKIEAYQGSDGRIFLDKKACIDNEKFLRLRKTMYKDLLDLETRRTSKELENIAVKAAAYGWRKLPKPSITEVHGIFDYIILPADIEKILNLGWRPHYIIEEF